MVEENQLGFFSKKRSLKTKRCSLRTKGHSLKTKGRSLRTKGRSLRTQGRSLRTKECCLVEKVPWQTYSPDPELPPLSATASQS